MPPGRTNVKGNASKEKKFARQPYTNAFKVAVIEHFRQNKSIASTMDKFFSTVSHSKLESKKQMVRKWGLGTVLAPCDELRIVKWVKDLRTEGIPVTPLMLQLQAQQVAQDAGMPENAFKGSHPWIKRFLRQHKLSLRCRTRARKTTIAQAEAAQTEFVNRIQTLIVKHRITRIFNADQTGINHEYLPKRTINTTGEKTVWIKCIQIEGASHVVNVAQRHGFGIRKWANVCQWQNETGAQIYGNPTAWWNTDLSIQFLDFHFKQRANPEEKILLVAGRNEFAAAKLIPREPCENVYASALEHETTHVVLAMEKLGLTDPQMPAISDEHDIDSLECDDDDDEACDSDE
ncbi:TPA: hypothetical protein N0F65_004746 [Lagenidium giganteum]|uniref:HTH CENPB-type domain-containing protein n=1 Tax=Lagenidium giganteum TaxID=4803 RepID=A0AAV2YQ51_9STRA|nr:TPA: hypothetical protein N0F65_004746 [Lagenidium giganteum]